MFNLWSVLEVLNTTCCLWIKKLDWDHYNQHEVKSFKHLGREGRRNSLNFAKVLMENSWKRPNGGAGLTLSNASPVAMRQAAIAPCQTQTNDAALSPVGVTREYKAGANQSVGDTPNHLKYPRMCVMIRASMISKDWTRFFLDEFLVNWTCASYKLKLWLDNITSVWIPGYRLDLPDWKPSYRNIGWKKKSKLN